MAILTSGNATIKNAHWYTKKGDPMHRMAKVDGTGDRATTIADAKRLGLLPSVTGILSVLDRPALMNWKIEKVLRAAASNPPGAEESVEYWMKRVQDLAYVEVESAADLGTQIHAALDAAFDGEPVSAELTPYVQPVLAWIAQTGIKVVAREQRIVSLEHGYAGTTDVLFTYGASGIGILDYKTKKTKPGEKVTSYLEHKAQLSAYAAAWYGRDRLKDVLAANLFISSTEPGRLEVVKHTEVEAYHDLFIDICAVWRGVKQYDPRGSAEAAA